MRLAIPNIPSKRTLKPIEAYTDVCSVFDVIYTSIYGTKFPYCEMFESSIAEFAGFARKTSILPKFFYVYCLLSLCILILPKYFFAELGSWIGPIANTLILICYISLSSFMNYRVKSYHCLCLLELNLITSVLKVYSLIAEDLNKEDQVKVSSLFPPLSQKNPNDLLRQLDLSRQLLNDLSERLELSQKLLEDMQTKANNNQLTRGKSSKIIKRKTDEVNRLFSLLEEIASCLEKHVSKKIRAKDNATDQWLKNMLLHTSNMLRSSKKDIIVSDINKQKKLIDHLVCILTCSLRGTWGELERLGSEKILPEPKTRHELIKPLLNFGRTLLLALLPILLFACFQLTPYAVKGEWQNFIVLGLFIWMGITFLVKYDPDTPTKFALLKDAKDLLTKK